MKFCRYPHYLPLKNPSVITIGHFDGVHVGHQALINKTKEVAEKERLNSILVTMEPLASQYFQGREKIPILTPFKMKFQLIKSLGLSHYCALNFNEKLSLLSAEEFIQKIIVKGLNAKHIVVGEDFRFGYQQEGNVSYLESECEKHGIELECVKPVQYLDEKISSTRIRESLSKGKFDDAVEMLGREFSIKGRVAHGQKLGRELGFPTLNIPIKRIKSPLSGVFCVSVVFNDRKTYQGAASIGTRPTVNGVNEILEVFLFDFDMTVYGENVEVLFHHKIRNEVKFETLDEMKSKINEDVIQIKEYFNSNSPNKQN